MHILKTMFEQDRYFTADFNFLDPNEIAYITERRIRFKAIE